MKKLLMFAVLFASVLCWGGSIGGYVSDASNGERLSYANVMIPSLQKGTSTSREGVFSLRDLPAGRYMLRVNCMGYGSYELEVVLSDELDAHYLAIELEREAISIAGSEISGTVKQKRVSFDMESREINLGKMQLQGELITEMPQAADADVIRSLEVLPGVQSMNESSNGLYVRGGTPDQNQILLDNTEVYNPSHLGGIFSTFNSDAIADVELYKAGYPASYGDRLSSVMDIRNKDGNRKELEGIVRLSMMSSSATIEGPWKAGSEQGSWMGSFRRTLYELLDFDIPDSYFYDGHLKINWDAGIKDKVFVSSYFGEDHLSMNDGEEMEMGWGNNTFTGQWLHVFNSQMYGKLNLASSNFHFDLEQIFDGEDSVTQENKINDITLRTDLHWQVSEQHEWEAGGEFKNLDITFGVDTDIDINSEHYPWLSVPSWQGSVYCQDIWTINSKLTLQPGMRATWCRTKSEYHPDGDIEDYWRISPRLAMRYKLAEKLNMSISYGRYYQYLTATNRSDWPMSLWMPIDGSVEPGEADHFVSGLQMALNDNVSMQIEGYYKMLRNQVSIDEDVFLEWQDGYYLSDAFKVGDGYAWGAEMLVNTNWQGWEGFFSYCYSQSKLKVDGINENPLTGEAEYYYPQHDRTHSISMMENYHLSENTGIMAAGAEITLGVLFSYGSGQPVQTPEGIYEDVYGWQFVDGYLDNDRLPDYSRLDLSIKFMWVMGDWNIEPYIMMVNALDRENVWTRNWYTEVQDNEALLLHRDTYMFSRMPFVGININW